MKQKIFGVILICLVFITILTGCDPIKQYKGNNLDLFSVAVNSLLGADGYGSVGYPPQLKVIEEDSYGRKLFSYQGDGFVPTYSILICQKSDDKYAYYYPDFNFISIEYDSNLIPQNIFSDEEVNELKNLNDWNNEINEEKCIKVKIIREKNQPKITKSKEKQFEQIIKKLAKDTGYKGKDTIFRYAIYCTTDNYGRTLYYTYGVGRDVNGEDVSSKSLTRYFNLVIIFNKDGTFDETICVMELSDKYSYQAELKQFKYLNGWNQP